MTRRRRRCLLCGRPLPRPWWQLWPRGWMRATCRDARACQDAAAPRWTYGMGLPGDGPPRETPSQ